MFADTALSALGNAMLILNSADALSLGEELINIRSKTQVQRFIPPVSPQAKMLWRLITVFLVPAALIFYGLIHAARRRRRREICEGGMA